MRIESAIYPERSGNGTGMRAGSAMFPEGQACRRYGKGLFYILRSQAGTGMQAGSGRQPEGQKWYKSGSLFSPKCQVMACL